MSYNTNTNTNMTMTVIGTKNNPHPYKPRRRLKKDKHFYINKKGELAIWNQKQKIFKCQHNRKRNICKECGGIGICEHNRQRSNCKDCGGSQICEHNRRRSKCKECGGSQICEHNRQRSNCKDCGGGSICQHNRRRSTCKECGGGSICQHNRIKYKCKECGGGSICEHNRIKYKCKECGGGSICEHNRERRQCKICHPDSYLSQLMRNRTLDALKAQGVSKNKRTMEYVNCSVEYLYRHLESQFTEGMNWDTHGKDDGKGGRGWEIDHIRPCASFDLSDEEEKFMCFHWTNLQPMWGQENNEKGDDYDPETFPYKWVDRETGWIKK